MAATALDIISLDRAKEQLQVDTVSDAVDRNVTDAVKGSVDYIQKTLGIPLIDRNLYLFCRPPFNADHPIAWDKKNRYVSSIASIEYWTAAGNLREEADGSIDTSDLGRLLRYYNERYDERYIVGVYPPEGGWPDVLSYSGFNVKLVESITKVPDAIMSAIILRARGIYEGYEETIDSPQFNSLIDNYRTWLP